MAKEDEGASIKCVFVPVFGDPIEVQKSINPGCEYRILKQYFLERGFYIIHDLKKLTIDQRITFQFFVLPLCVGHVLGCFLRKIDVNVVASVNRI